MLHRKLKTENRKPLQSGSGLRAANLLPQRRGFYPQMAQMTPMSRRQAQRRPLIYFVGHVRHARRAGDAAP